MDGEHDIVTDCPSSIATDENDLVTVRSMKNYSTVYKHTLHGTLGNLSSKKIINLKIKYRAQKVLKQKL